MSAISSTSMLHIEYPPSAMEIKPGNFPTPRAVPVPEAPYWVQAWAYRQEQAQDDMVQLYNTITDVDMRASAQFKQIEDNYDSIYMGTKCMFDYAENQTQEIKNNLDGKIAEVASSHEAFTSEARQMITTNTQGKKEKWRARAVETQRIKDAVAFVQQIGMEKEDEEAIFRSNLDNWAEQNNQAVSALEKKLASAIKEIEAQKRASKNQDKRIEELEQEAVERSSEGPTPPDAFPKTHKERERKKARPDCANHNSNWRQLRLSPNYGRTVRKPRGWTTRPLRHKKDAATPGTLPIPNVDEHHHRRYNHEATQQEHHDHHRQADHPAALRQPRDLGEGYCYRQTWPHLQHQHWR